jgi:HD-GYP domain-containing protein (c-di-GMP phosphodiesterase class II)
MRDGVVPDEGKLMQGGHDTDERLFQIAAQNLIGSFFVLLKVATLHQMDNRAVTPAINRFGISLKQFLENGESSAALQFVGDGIYCNQRLIRADLETWEKARYIKDTFAKLDIGEIVFDGIVPEKSLRDFVSFMLRASSEPAASLEIRTKNFERITFRELRASGVDKHRGQINLPDPVRVLRAFGVIVVTLREALAILSRREPLSLLQVRRAVQEFVRLPPHTDSLQLGLLALEQFGGELAGRLARVGVTVVMMGKRLGLGVPDVREMGVTASLATSGRVFDTDLELAPLERLAETDLLTQGMRHLTMASGRGRPASLRLITAAELSDVGAWRTGHPLTRLVAVAEKYQELISRGPGFEGLPPYEALRRISEDPRFDPAAALTLVSTVGLFPVGSMVRLSTGDTGIVIDGPGCSADPSRPRVMVVTGGKDGAGQGRVIDLADAGLSIARTVDAADLDLNVGHLLFA